MLIHICQNTNDNQHMPQRVKEILQKEYDEKLSYNYCISAAIVQGEHDLAFNFMKKNTDMKGIDNVVTMLA